MAKNKKREARARMSIADILKYFEHYFEIEEVNKFATENVVNEYTNLKLSRRLGAAIFDANGAVSVDEEAANKAFEERKQNFLTELRAVLALINKGSQEELKSRFDEIERTLIRCTNSDTYATYGDFVESSKLLASYPGSVRIPDLLLYCAFRSQTNLFTFSGEGEVSTGRINNTQLSQYEVYDGKGDIYVSRDGKNYDRKSHHTFPEYVEPFNRKKMCSDSIKKMFKAQKELRGIITNKDKLKKMRIRFKIGQYEKYRMESVEYGFDNLEKALHTKTVWQNIDYTHIDEWIAEGIVTKEEILEAYRNGRILPKDLAIVNELGILPQIEDELNNNPEVQKNRLFADLLLFSRDKMKIELIEALLSKEPEQRDNITEEMIEELSSGFNRFDIRHSLYSLLIHDVLDYDQSMLLIKKIKSSGKIKDDDEEFLKQGIHDFKVNQLLNLVKSEPLVTFGQGVSTPTIGRLTIDPYIRAKFFEDIGGVKSLFINGSFLINDEDGKKKKNSLDGYQLLVFPNKGVAVLEKFFETQHTKDGKVEYKTDKEGNLIPAIENATYVIPIEKAVEYATRKNKKGLRQMKNGMYTIYHSANWVKYIEKAMKRIAPQYAKFDEEKMDEWSKAVKEDYDSRL